MQSFQLEQKILLLNTEKKDKVNIYTFVNLDTNETQTVVGVKETMPLHKPLIASIKVKISREVFDLTGGEKKYINAATLFITELKEVNQ